MRTWLFWIATTPKISWLCHWCCAKNCPSYHIWCREGGRGEGGIEPQWWCMMLGCGRATGEKCESVDLYLTLSLSLSTSSSYSFQPSLTTTSSSLPTLLTLYLRANTLGISPTTLLLADTCINYWVAQNHCPPPQKNIMVRCFMISVMLVCLICLACHPLIFNTHNLKIS